MRPCVGRFTLSLLSLQLNHPNLVQLLDYFEDKEYYFLVMEMMTGGELFTRIVEKVGCEPVQRVCHLCLLPQAFLVVPSV